MRQKRSAIPVRNSDDLKAFFESCGGEIDQHGDDGRLFDGRVAAIREQAGLSGRETVLDLGCGDGRYLMALAGHVGRGLGVDLARGMVEAAQRRWRNEGAPGRIAFNVDDIEHLATVADGSIDVAFAVGVVEHVLDRVTAFRSVRRVLKPGGRFVCLTPNGSAPLYKLARLAGRETRYLTTDRHLTRRELRTMLGGEGFSDIAFSGWSFVPRGDISNWLANTLWHLDRFGAATGIETLRGGLLVRCVKDG